ncbi:hypothetical protein NUSPORA_00233 [Nucleospora cyclopteri]
MFLIFLLTALTRHILIKPNDKLVFFDEISAPTLYKFIYDTRNNCKITFEDPAGLVIANTQNQTGAIHTMLNSTGFVKITVENLTNQMCKFSYKVPDVNKEVTGYLGYIEETDLIGELTTILDKLVDQQKSNIANTKDHQKLVQNSKKWVRLLALFELVSIALVVYILHKDFVSMFETKRSL